MNYLDFSTFKRKYPRRFDANRVRFILDKYPDVHYTAAKCKTGIGIIIKALKNKGEFRSLRLYYEVIRFQKTD